MKIHNGERLCPTNQSPFLPLLCQFQVHSWLITKVSQKKGKMAKIDAKGKINICSWMALGLISKFSPPTSESNNYGNIIIWSLVAIDTLFIWYVSWWRWHSSKYFFIKRKLSRNLWGSMFILTNSLNFFAGTSKTSFNLDLKTWGKFVCFDLLVVGASSSLLYAKLITKNCQKNFPNWNWFYMFQQKNSKKLLR